METLSYLTVGGERKKLADLDARAKIADLAGTNFDDVKELINKVDSFSTQLAADEATIKTNSNNISAHAASIKTNSNNISTLQTNKQDKLTAGDGITISGTTISATSSTNITVDAALSTQSTNPAQNKVITTAINNKADSKHTHIMNDITDAASLTVNFESGAESVIFDGKTAKTITIPAPAGSYILPEATSSKLGGVKIGSGISVTSDGTISSKLVLSSDNQTFKLSGNSDSEGIKIDWDNLVNRPSIPDETEFEQLKTDSHTHKNKTLLDSYDQTNDNIKAVITAKHSHKNLSLLETYTQTEDNLKNAVFNSHTHSNKAILDNIDHNLGAKLIINQPTSTGDTTKIEYDGSSEIGITIPAALSAATNTRLGGVIIGNNSGLTIAASGALSVTNDFYAAIQTAGYGGTINELATAIYQLLPTTSA